MKLTPWFPAGMKPARPGVYKTVFVSDGRTGYSRWNGMEWGHQFKSRSDAENINMGCGEQFKIWRGLAEEPKS